MMLAFFWSVADCNRHGCAVQWDALCQYPNHKKTHTKENKKKGNRHRKHAVSMCLSLRRFAAVSPFCFGYPAQPDIAS